MKKNTMMRLASFLLIAVLITTSAISGTYAKYVTTAEGSDTARVAKWGVVASVSGDLFGATYKEAADNTIITYAVNGGTVSSFDGAMVVAPGTENKQGMTLSVTGTPEVATKVTFTAAENDAGADYANSDIYLAVGNYGVMVKYTGVVTEQNIVDYYVENSGTYTKATAADVGKAIYALCDTAEVTGNDYHPLKWYVDGTEVDNQEAVTTKLVDTFNGKTFAPNKDNALSATIGWSWNFGTAWDDAVPGENTTAIDKQDTILGNMITRGGVAVVAKDGEAYVTVTYADEKAATDAANEVVNVYAGDKKVACLTVAYNARVIVEQVD